MTLSASIVIVTRNRCDDVMQAVESALAQQHEPLEVLVYDDASTDGTCDAIAQQFPSVRLVRSDSRRGYIALRNRGFAEARGDIVFSIDDDAYFTNERTVADAVALFEQQPTVAAVALPYIEPRMHDPQRLMQTIPDDRLLRGFVGCAHALRREVVNQIGRYREFFIHQGEERDLSIRLLDAGHLVLFADTGPIVHTFSPKRDHERISYYAIRNTLLFDMLNLPLRYMIPRLVIDAFNLFRYRLTLRILPSRLRYVLAGFTACLRYLPHRRPVSAETYKTYRARPGHGPMAAEGAEAKAAIASRVFLPRRM